jgi:anaerobic dimethyl sulfoxide reductase subunit A
LSESTNGEGIIGQNVSRRSVLKWSGALAAAGIVGIGLGIGGDLLIRPSTTRTTTSTATATGPTTTSTVTGPTTTRTTTSTTTTTNTATSTLTVPPTTLSYVPPLSPSVQTRVNQIIQDMISSHQGETLTYVSPGLWAGFADPSNLVVESGTPIGVVPENLVNPLIAREDAYLSESDVWSGKLRGIPWGQSWVLPWQFNDPTRILYSMQRVGPRATSNGQFMRITWDQAIAAVVSLVQQCKSQYGNYSVATGMTCSYTDPELVLYGVAAGSGWGCSSVANHVVAGMEVLGGYASPPNNDSLNAHLIVLWALDPSSAGMTHWGSYFLSLAKEKGIPIIAIDYRYTMAAEALADQWIPIRPGTDMAMMLAVANVLFKENLYDQDFVSQFVEPTGFQNFQNYVLGNTAGFDNGVSPDGAIDRTPEWAEQICGVPAATITAFAELYAQSQPTQLLFGWGGARQSRGINVARAVLYLQAMTGNIGLQGGGVDGQPGFSPISPIGAPMSSIEPEFGIYLQGPPYLFAEFKMYDAILMRDGYQNGTITQEEYYSAIGNNINNPAPNIHGIFGLGGNNTPVYGRVNVNKVINALANVDFFVVGHRHFDSTAQFADIVLPLTQYYEEAAGFQTCSRGFVYVPRIITPPGETRDVSWIHMQIANGLGVGAQFLSTYNYPAGFATATWPDEWDTLTDSYLQSQYETWASSSAVTAVLPNPPTWDQLKANPVVRIDLPNPPPIPFSAQISGGKPFGTASGKIEFYNANLETFDLSKIWAYGTPGQGAPIAPMAIWESPEEGFFDPNAATYPLVLGNSQHKRHTQYSMAWPNPMIEGEVYRHTIWMSVADASSRGIVDGDLVKVFNDRGTVLLTAYVTSRQVPGSVCIYSHQHYTPNLDGVDTGGNGNVLTNDNLLAAAAGQEPCNALVQVELFTATQATTTATTTGTTVSS